MESAFSPFEDARQVARYAEGPVRMVPGFADLQRMACLLLQERVPATGRVLVVGAGGGLELKVFSDRCPDWTYLAVEPALEMIQLGKRYLGQADAKVDWHHGYLDSAKFEGLDGATCLLTMHFVPHQERTELLHGIASRLKPGAPLIIAHMSIPELDRDRWLKRYADFAADSGVEPEKAKLAMEAVQRQLHVCSPDLEQQMLLSSGFEDIQMFYAGFVFRGWVGYRTDDEGAGHGTIRQ